MITDPFLFKRVSDDAVERVLDINRHFENGLLIGNAEISTALLDSVGDRLGHVVLADHTTKVSGLNVLCDEEALPFSDGSFDFIFSGLSLHAVNQIPKTLVDLKAKLRPDGLLICALFGGETLAGLRHALYEAEDKIYGRVSPRVSPMIDMQQAAALLQKAGFTMPVVDRDLVKVSYKRLEDLFTDLRFMGENNALVGRIKTPSSKRLFDGLAEIYHRDHLNENGKLMAHFDILWMTGWTPHPDQQKPLKPGSAKTRLSQALGVKEHKL